MVDRRRESLSEILFEFIPVGNAVKVSAIDPITRIEVSIVGDPHVGVEALKRVAARKLEYVIAKRTGTSGPKQR